MQQLYGTEWDLKNTHMPRIVARPPGVHVAVLVAAELHHRHTFTKRAMIPAGTRTGPGRKGKMEVSKHTQKLSSKTTESLLNKPNLKTNSQNYKLQK